jgi:hypothetical protein
MKNEYKITKELMKSWAKGYHFKSIHNIISLIFGCCLFLFGAVWSFEIYYLLGYHIIYFPDYLMAEIIFNFAALLPLYMIFIRPTVLYKKTYKAYSKIYDVPEWMRTIEFTDTEIVVTDHTSVDKYLYKNIKGFRERKDHVIINFSHGIGIRIYKNAFAEGTWEDCKKLISEKRKNR